MGKKIFEVYLAKEDVPNNEAYAKLDLPASLWELWDALDKVRLQTDDILYMEIEDYDAFEYLSPHLDGLDISLNELNDLAALLSALDEVQEVAFEGLFSIEVQRKVNANGGVITLQDLRDLAVSAKTDCYHVVEAADDAQLGRFYAENEFIPELDGISNEVFEMLDFAGIGRMMRCSENGVFVGNLYVLQDGELTTAPPVQKTLPEKPGYLFQLTLGLHPDIGDARTVTLDLPAAEAELLDAQAQRRGRCFDAVLLLTRLSEKFESFYVDFRHIVLYRVAVLPHAGAEFALDVEFRALADILFRIFGVLAPHHDVVYQYRFYLTHKTSL